MYCPIGSLREGHRKSIRDEICVEKQQKSTFPPFLLLHLLSSSSSFQPSRWKSFSWVFKEDLIYLFWINFLFRIFIFLLISYRKLPFTAVTHILIFQNAWKMTSRRCFPGRVDSAKNNMYTTATFHFTVVFKCSPPPFPLFSLSSLVSLSPSLICFSFF